MGNHLGIVEVVTLAAGALVGISTLAINYLEREGQVDLRCCDPDCEFHTGTKYWKSAVDSLLVHALREHQKPEEPNDNDNDDNNNRRDNALMTSPGRYPTSQLIRLRPGSA